MVKKDNIITARTCVYDIMYHIVWTVEHRRNVLTKEIEQYLIVLFQEIAEEKGFEVISMEVGEQDHIRVYARAHPKIAPSYMVKMLKGISGRKLFLQFPEIKDRLWKGRLWSNSYFIETVGYTNANQIKEYLAKELKQ